jgi:2-polyprenyl-3-methyl-5-hydroxy-6-metoxy-1,4-benzoquinol methylase
VIVPSLAERDLDAHEQMDDPGCDDAKLRRTYAQFRVINAVVTGWRMTYRRHVRPLLRRDRATTLLDIGCGGGDLSRSLRRWAARDGYRLEVTGVDPDPRAHEWATGRPPVPGVAFRRGFSSELVADGAGFDVVISNHVLHHLDEAQLQGLLADSRRLARLRVVHSDIARNRWAYLLFSVGTWPFFPGSYIRADGLVSIRRSYTPAELADVLPAGWRVEPQAPWRSLVLHDGAGT